MDIGHGSERAGGGAALLGAWLFGRTEPRSRALASENVSRGAKGTAAVRTQGVRAIFARRYLL